MRLLLRFYWLCRTAAPYVMGRVYVFRAAPDWFVNEVAAAPDGVKSWSGYNKDDVDRAKSFVREAQFEQQLRKRKAA